MHYIVSRSELFFAIPFLILKFCICLVCFAWLCWTKSISSLFVYVPFGVLVGGEFVVEESEAGECAVGNVCGWKKGCPVVPLDEAALVIWKEKRMGGMEYMSSLVNSCACGEKLEQESEKT